MCGSPLLERSHLIFTGNFSFNLRTLYQNNIAIYLPQHHNLQTSTNPSCIFYPNCHVSLHKCITGFMYQGCLLFMNVLWVSNFPQRPHKPQQIKQCLKWILKDESLKVARITGRWLNQITQLIQHLRFNIFYKTIFGKQPLNFLIVTVVWSSIFSLTCYYLLVVECCNKW